MTRVRRSSVREILRRLPLLSETPQRTALAFGVGVFWGFSPFWGLHSVLGLTTAVLFRLNRLAVMVGVWVNTPWTGAPVASVGTAVGLLILGGGTRVPGIQDPDVSSEAIGQRILGDVQHLLLPFLLGNLLIATVAGLAGYYVLRWILLRNAARSPRWD